MADEKKSSFRSVVWIVGFLFVFVSVSWGWYSDWTRQRHIKAVMDGPIHVNKQSGIYHVPTCPHYSQMYDENMMVMNTIVQAREAGFRQASNCGEDFQIREINESDAYDDTAPEGSEGPRQ